MSCTWPLIQAAGVERAILLKWQPKAKGAALIVAAAFMYAAMNGAAKVGSGYLTIWQIGMGRFLFGTVILFITARVLRMELLGTHRLLHVIRAVAGAAAFLLLVQAFKTIPISVAMILFYSWPAFTSLLAAWVLGEPTSPREWPFVGGAFLGAGLILWPGEAGAGFSLGHLLALSAAVIGSLAIILVRRLARDNNPLTIYFYLCLVGALACLGPLLSQEGSLWPTSGAGWLALLVMAVPSLLSQLFFNKGYKYLRAPQTGVLMYLELLFLAAFGIIFLGEPLDWRLLSGAALIVGSGIWLNLKPANP